jgi:hypothetical protein
MDAEKDQIVSIIRISKQGKASSLVPAAAWRHDLICLWKKRECIVAEKNMK